MTSSWLRQSRLARGQQPESTVVTHEEDQEEGDDNTLDGEPIPLPKIYLNEDLTKTRAVLLWNTSQLKNAKELKVCWFNDGRTFIEDEFGWIKQMKIFSDLDGLNWLKWQLNGAVTSIQPTSYTFLVINS